MNTYASPCARRDCRRMAKWDGRLNTSSYSRHPLFFCTIHLKEARTLYHHYKTKEATLFQPGTSSYQILVLGEQRHAENLEAWMRTHSASHTSAALTLREAADLRDTFQTYIAVQCADRTHTAIPSKLRLLADYLDPDSKRPEPTN